MNQKTWLYMLAAILILTAMLTIVKIPLAFGKILAGLLMLEASVIIDLATKREK